MIVEILLTTGTQTSIHTSMKLEKAASQLEAIGNPTRLQLYRILVRAGDDGLAVASVQEKLAVPASTLSHHLKRLVDTGLVTQERQVQIPMKPAMHSEAMPATYSNFIPVGIPI